MERLTDTTGQLYACGNGLCAFEPKQMCSDCKYQYEVSKRLAAYEDTGLSPEEVAKLKVDLEAANMARPYVLTGDAAINFCQTLELSEIEADRDRWKARAEALERAILGDCTYCTHMTCKMPCACIRGSGWQFDESLFATKKEG